MMLCFELTIPDCGDLSSDFAHAVLKTARSKAEIQKFKELDGGNWFYEWDEGIAAHVTARIIDGGEAKKIRKKNNGPCGLFEWMVESILKHGEIICEKWYCRDLASQLIYEHDARSKGGDKEGDGK